ncbi:hypothetical protein SUDANB91_07163 (plasmid) [Streptomyces sp. SudanB91_2054]
MPVQITVLASGHHRSHPCSPRMRRLIQLTAQLTVRTSAAHLAQRQIRMVPRARASCWLGSPRRVRVPSTPPRLPAVVSCLPAPGQRVKAQRRKAGRGVDSLACCGLRSVFWKAGMLLEVASHRDALVLNQPVLVREFQSRAAVAAQLSVLSGRTACLAEPVALLSLLHHDSPGAARSVGVSMRSTRCSRTDSRDLCASFFPYDRVWNLEATGIRRVCCLQADWAGLGSGRPSLSRRRLTWRPSLLVCGLDGRVVRTGAVVWFRWKGS